MSQPQPLLLDQQIPDPAKAYTKPKPSPLLMCLAKPVIRTLALLGLPLLRHIPFRGLFSLLRGLAWIRNIGLPKADRQRLAQAVTPQTVAFMAPNHPELFTDWMLDVEVFGKYAPHFAAMATPDIVNGPLKPFWLRQNLVAATPGGEGLEYATKHALDGKGTLIHPEGEVRYYGDRIQRVYPGVIKMAYQAALRSRRGDQRPVFIVPTVWKLFFTQDVSVGLQREMDLIERRLGLPEQSRLSVARRFVELQKNLLKQQEGTFGLVDDTPLLDGDFFARQKRLVEHLYKRFRDELGLEPDQVQKWRRLLVVRARALSGHVPGTPEWAKRGVAELKRLGDFNQEVYGGPKLSQEQIAESLKRLRYRLLNTKLLEQIANLMPSAAGPRRAEVRVAEPVDVMAMVDGGFVQSPDQVSAFLDGLRGQMQKMLDELNSQISGQVAPFSVDNPLASRP